MDRLRIAHCSDIHLDGDSYTTPATDGQRHCRRFFAEALQSMQAHRPDLMLLAGDLFDTNRVDTETIEWAMETLSRQPFPVIMIPGNHDCMADGAIFHRYDFNRIANVRMLSAMGGEMTTLPELGVAAWGKGMVEHSSAYLPLDGCPTRPEGCKWFLGLAHGLFIPHGEESYRSSPIHMREIEASPCDYLALGHHHAALKLVNDKASAAYSGSPTDEAGVGRSYIIVDLATGAKPAVELHTVS